MVVPLPSHCGDPLRRISLLLPTLFFSTSTSTSSSTLNLLPPPKPCPGGFPLVLFYRSLLRLLTCSIFHFLLCPFVRVFSLPLSPSPFSALLISALSTVCLSSFCMFESCLFFGCWLSLLVLYSHWYLFLTCMLFSFPFFPAQFPCCLYEYFHLSGLVIPFYLYFGCFFIRLS